eukprot:749263-Hanusia_phi.AAC.9
MPFVASAYKWLLCSGDLDTKNTELVLRMLVDLNKRYGITMIMVTHDIHLRNYADRIVHLRDGKVRSMCAPWPAC